MSRNLIDRDALTKMIKSICCHAEDETDLLDALKEMPTIDAVEVVHGTWVHEFGGFVNCSECGASPLLDGEREYVETNYCPNCGAKMDGEGRDPCSSQDS